MLFTINITAPKNTTKASPVIDTLKIAHGIITWVSVVFPPGCAGLAHCVILHHEHQFVPSTETMDLRGDTFPIEWDEYYESYQPPYELKVKAWNEDDTYSHTVTVRVAVLPKKAVMPVSLTEAIKGIFGMISPKRVYPPEF